MTARQQLNAKCRKFLTGMSGGSAVAIISGLLTFQTSAIKNFSFCPRCGTSLDQEVAT